MELQLLNANHVKKNNNNTYIKKINSQLTASDVNKFDIDFKLETLIDKPQSSFVSTKSNPNMFVFVLETTTDKYNKYINIPNIFSFYKDFIGVHAEYNFKKNKVINYAPRITFKYFNNNLLTYDTIKVHSNLKKHSSIINIIKFSKQINAKEYITNSNLLNNIFTNVINLFDIQGGNKNQIAKFIIHILEQTSFVNFINFVHMIFNNKITISDRKLTVIRKIKNKYIIKFTNDMLNLDTGFTYKDKFNITYIIDENDTKICIIINIRDIENILKLYPHTETQNNLMSHTQNNQSSININYKQINFLSY